MNLGPYAKAVSATVVAGFTSAIAALADGSINGVEWAGIAVTVLVAAGAVYAVPNFPSRARSYAKAITAGLVGGLGSLAVALTDGGGVSQAEWLTIAIAVLVGAGLVSQVPNANLSGTVTDLAALATPPFSATLAAGSPRVTWSSRIPIRTWLITAANAICQRNLQIAGRAAR